MEDDNSRRSMFISDSLWDRMKKAARDEDRTISAWLRNIIRAALEKTKTSV